MRRQSKNTIPTLKRKAWAVFSKFIRVRDCINSTGSKTRGYCFTCGRELTPETGQAGHFIPGRTASVLFEPLQVHLQCYACNVRMHGNWPAYYERMIDEFGLEEVEKMLSKRHETHKWLRTELEEIHEKYSKLLTDLQGK